MTKRKRSGLPDDDLSKPKKRPHSAESVQAALSISRPQLAKQTTTSTQKGLPENAPSKLEAQISEAPIPAPPPGSNRRQRKRWRKEQKRLAKGGESGHPHSKPGTASSLPQASQAPSKSKSIIQPKRLDRFALLEAARTALMVRRPRVWHDDGPHAQDNSTLRPVKGKAKAKSSAAEATTAPTNVQQQSIKSAKPMDIPAIEVSHCIAVSSGGSCSPRMKTPATQTPRLQIPRVFKPSIRRTSFTQKPNSIPSVTVDKDPEAAFKRFSAFLRKGKSEEDSSSSESESDDDDIAKRSTNAQETTIRGSDHPNFDDEGQISAQPIVSVRGPAFTETDLHDSEEETMSAKLRLPILSSPNPAASTSINAEAQQANIGIKRQTSSLDPPIGGLPSGDGSDMVDGPNTRVPHDPWHVSEAESRETQQIMDEISESLLLDTRPLPAGKFETGLDAVEVTGADGLTTWDSRDIRLNDSPATTRRLRSSSRVEAKTSADTGPLVCNTTQPAPGIGTGMVMGNEHGPPSRSATSMSSNIVVATPNIANAASTSSSSLSELTRTPSAPSDVVPQGLEITGFHKEADDAQQIPTSDTVLPGPSPAKKRKMTGRTSKHFTPAKQPKRKRIATAVVIERPSSTNIADAVDYRLRKDHTPETEDSFKAMFRPQEAGKPLGTPVRWSRRVLEIPETPDYREDVVHEDLASDVEHKVNDKPPTPVTAPEEPPPQPKKKRKSTGKKSAYFTPPKPTPTLDPAIIDRVDFYNTTSSSRKARVPAGTSICPFPSIHSPRFGIIQEKLWQEPFWLLIAVTFLNKTTGRAAVPVFWALKEKYGTPEALAKADQEELEEIIRHLGLQRARSKRLILMAAAWVEQPPARGRRWRRLHYPLNGDGKDFKPGQCVEEDADDCKGAVEIGHIPGCGPYAFDSWRIFCRDVLRGVAEDYTGAGGGEGFVAEWKKVIPGDKELRACLRWMWLREGWIWNHETGERREATDEEMEKAVKGEVEVDDPVERKFAAQAAGAELAVAPGIHKEVDVATAVVVAEHPDERVGRPLSTPITPEPSSEAGSNIIVTPSPRAQKAKTSGGGRRSRRLTS